MSADQPPPEPSADSPQSLSFAFDTNSAGDASAAAPLDPLTAEVARILAQPPPNRTWLQSALLLTVTLVMFAMAGFFSYTFTDLILLVGVLLFHELGHYLGMRLFNYQDVRMFFIPFFGAAVAGRPTSVQGYQEAIVLLLGPLPGIALGAVLGAACMFHDNPILRSAASMLLAVNGFNLLPLLPLDGGRLMHLILFSRQRHLEAAFQVVTAVLLAVVGLSLGAWFLAILGAFMLLSVGVSFRVSRLAWQLRGPPEEGDAMNLSARIPPDRAVPLIQRAREAFPEVKQAGTLANLVRQVWERMHLRPPGLAASLLLLTIFGGSFLATPVMAMLFHMPMRSVVPDSRRADGTMVQRQEVRVWGRLREFTELGPDGQFQGRHVEYFPTTGRVKVEGSFANGRPNGKWTFYREDGQVDHGNRGAAPMKPW